MSNPLITPLIVPQIDWGTYIDFMFKATGYSPTRILDFNHKEIGPVSSFLLTLGKENHILDLCSYAFLMELTLIEYTDILSRTQLKIKSVNQSNIRIVSGTIKEWRDACLEFCNDVENFNSRYLFDCVYIYMNKLNLFTLNKYGLKDQTFTLSEPDT